MPLSFKSENHGNIAFGFFNIESDMLLLENYFFFADEFCRLISDAAVSLPDETENLQGSGQKESEFGLKVYHIADPSDIGDLMGAIHGMHFTGFIGETYKVFPFPENPWDFKTQLKQSGSIAADMVNSNVDGQNVSVSNLYLQ